MEVTIIYNNQYKASRQYLLNSKYRKKIVKTATKFWRAQLISGILLHKKVRAVILQASRLVITEIGIH